jgi:hypothetical protein
MLNRLILKLLGRRTIWGTSIDANPENTAKPDYFYHMSYSTEEIVCIDCGNIFTHTAQEKRDFFEKEKGNIYKQFIRCRTCDEIKNPDRYITHNK